MTCTKRPRTDQNDADSEALMEHSPEATNLAPTPSTSQAVTSQHTSSQVTGTSSLRRSPITNAPTNSTMEPTETPTTQVTPTPSNSLRQTPTTNSSTQSLSLNRTSSTTQKRLPLDSIENTVANFTNKTAFGSTNKSSKKARLSNVSN